MSMVVARSVTEPGSAAARWPALAVAIVAFVASLLVIDPAHPPNPVNDAVQYLGYGRTLFATGRYALTDAGPRADAGPGREPLYPVLIAAAMHLDPVLRDNAARCIGNQSDPTCPPIYAGLLWLNALLAAVTAALVWLAAHRLGAGRRASWIAGLYLALDLILFKEGRLPLSDFPAMALAAALILALAGAAAERRAAWRWLAVGVVLALLILTKAVFELYGFALIGVLTLVFLRLRDRAALAALAAVTVALVVIVGGWAARNWAVFGRPSVTDSRGGQVLSTREIFDHMTAGEYAASFVYWARDPGERLARRLFSERDWHRLDRDAPDGFLAAGMTTRYDERVARLMDERHLDHAAAEAAVPGMIVGEFVRALPMYVATEIPLTWRGLWGDQFVFLGFPALLWLAVRSARRRDWCWVAALSPALFSLFLLPALSLNLYRFQLPAIPAMALAGGVALAAIADRLLAAARRR